MMQRNDKCHCGSNQKYKKCCLAKDELCKKESNKYVASPEMELTLSHLRTAFPTITFIDVTDELNARNYRNLQLRYFQSAVCQIATKTSKNCRVFNERDPDKHDFDLLLMRRGAYRILDAGDNVRQYIQSLKSFLAD